ncbi:hypothetical protein IAR50_003051 [Cryptococcus sp. DSM 104548]
MGRKKSGNPSISASKPTAAPGARINRMEDYEDTLEPGSVDDFMFKRDQINFNPQDESEDEDVNGDEGEEVLSLEGARRRAREEQEEEYDEEEEEDSAPVKKGRKEKVKPDASTKGRYGKPIVSSDEEEESSGSSDSEDENWGRQYYSKPSNRREKEKEGDFGDEKREEERDMEEREVKRLQKKQREVLGGDDFGMEDLEEQPLVSDVPQEVLESVSEAAPAAPKTADGPTLLRHLQAHEPLKLALTRDFPLVVQKLEKTARGINKMEETPEHEAELHKGLGWLHYQTLLTYATTLAFYIHLETLPASDRPDIPIIPRLFQLKQGVTMLEDLDFDAASSSGESLVLFDRYGDLNNWLESGDEDLKEGKLELIKRMQAVNGEGELVGLEDGEEAENGDEDDLWQNEGLDKDELAELLQDAGEDAEDIRALAAKSSKKKEEKSKKSKKNAEELDFEALLEGTEKPKKSKKLKKSNDSEASSSIPAFAPLAEPDFFPSKKSKSKFSTDNSDVLGDPTALTDADYTDKQSRKRSLAFHTSKINSTLARRAEGRAKRMGGDDDLPYRDKRKARDAALRKNGPSAEGEDLEDVSAGSEKTKKRARDEDAGDDEGAGEADEADGYYELVKRRRKDEKDAKQAEHDAAEAELLAERAAYDDESADGPRTITRAIEKNRGLTPRRSKTGRNPRVKKRQAYDKAQKKVASQRSVYKGGQSAYGGEYKGEKTGITQVVKSRKF